MMLAALLPRLGRFALALVAMVALILSAGLPDCVGHEHSDADHGETPSELSCPCVHVAVLPAPAVPMPLVLPVPSAETEYLVGSLPEVVFGVDPPPDKRA